MASNDEVLAFQMTTQCRQKAYMEKLSKANNVNIDFTYNNWMLLCPSDMLNITCPHMCSCSEIEVTHWKEFLDRC